LNQDELVAALLRRLDSPNWQAAYDTLKTFLESNSDVEAFIASAWVGLIDELPDEMGKARALRLITAYTAESDDVLELMLKCCKADTASTRAIALQSIMYVPTDKRVAETVLMLLDDEDPEIQRAAIQASGALLKKTTDTGASATVMVFPESEARRVALDLLNAIESAVKRLQDTSELEQGHHELIDKEILPSIASLKMLFREAATSRDHLREKRGASIFSLGRLKGAILGLQLTTTTIASSDDAGKVLAESAEKLEPIVDLLKSLPLA